MATQLKRCLSLSEIVIYGVGLILGAGVYVLIGAAAGIAGNMLWLSFLLAAIVAGFTAVSYSELSALYPEAGAEYIFVKTAFSSNGVAWVLGIVAIIIGFTTSSAVAVGFASYFNYFFPGEKVWIAAALIVVLSLVSFWGIQESARFNAVATSIEVGGLLIIILVGGYFIFSGEMAVANLTQFPEHAADSDFPLLPVVSAGALIFFAYMGFEDIANIAEEAERPTITLPRAFLLSLIISTVIYILIAIVAVSVVPYQELGESDQPLSAVMEILIGGKAPMIIALIALFATSNTVLITLIVCARMIYGVARSGSLPEPLAKVHASRRTPYVAVILTGLVSIAFLFFEKIEVLASISDVGIFILFLMVNLSNIMLRIRRPELQRPWRAPLAIGHVPLLSLAGAISCFLMLFTINHPVHLWGYEFSSLLIGLVVFGLTIPLYFVFGHQRSHAPGQVES